MIHILDKMKEVRVVIMIMLYEVKLAKSSSEPTFLRTIPGA